MTNEDIDYWNIGRAPKKENIVENCRHGSIVTYAISDGGDERMWACADCMIRLYPACRECVDVGHRNEKHQTPVLDEERLAADFCLAVKEVEAALVEKFGGEFDVVWDYWAVVKDAIAKAYREDEAEARNDTKAFLAAFPESAEAFKREAIAAERARIREAVGKLRREKPWPEFITAGSMAEAARTANNNAVENVLRIIDGDTDAHD